MFYENIFGKLVDDKGYMSKNLFEQLFVDAAHWVTKIRKNIKKQFNAYAGEYLTSQKGFNLKPLVTN